MAQRFMQGRRKYFREGMDRIASGGSLVDDREMQQVRDKVQEAGSTVAQAQTQAANRAAAATAAGSPVVAGAIKESARDIAKEGQKTAVRAQGAAEQFRASQEERRRAEIFAGGQQMLDHRQVIKQDARDFMFGVGGMLGLGPEMG